MNKNLIGKSSKISINVDPIALKMVLKAAESKVKYMVEHDMLVSGSKCTDTEDYVTALKKFKEDCS